MKFTVCYEKSLNEEDIGGAGAWMGRGMVSREKLLEELIFKANN